MHVKIKFMYNNEVWSFMNKTFTICAIAFYILLILVGYFKSDFITTIVILAIMALVYLGFIFQYIKIKNKYKYFKENGVCCKGTIKDIIVEENYSVDMHTWESPYDLLYLIVEYKDPYTNEIKQFKTEESVNGNPFVYLSSLEVTVYVLPDGKAFATDFKRIKKLKDAVKYKMK